MSAPRSPTAAPSPQLAAAAALVNEGRFREAHTLLLRLLRMSSGGGAARVHPHALYLLGIASDALSEHEQALHFFERAAAADPNDPQIALAHAHMLGNMRRFPDAAAALERFAASHPSDPGIATGRVSILMELNRDEEALRVAEAAHAAHGDHPDLCGAYGAVLNKLGRIDEALALYRRTGRVIREGLHLCNVGRVEEGVAVFRAATEKYPSDSAGWIQYAYAQNYSDEATPDEQTRAHRELGRTLRTRVGAPFTSWNVTRDPNRQLRVGIVSPDMRRHAVVSFLAPLLENYDKSQWRLTAYSTTRKKDDVTARLRTLVDEWCDVPNNNPRNFATRVRDNRIDVLIEVAGLTDTDILAGVHLRPAPVQVTYLGYPNTTGLDTVDLRVVDSITDPPGSERLAIERLARIDPCFLCYKPIVDSPPLAPPPSAAGKPIAFGSFNLPKKVSPRTLALWARTLAAVPGSTLVLKHAFLTEQWMRNEFSGRLAAAGIDASRVTVLLPMPSYSDHLSAYAQVDIALDTYPYHGTTTTCEALWMGVPVITLIGDRHASRVGASLLSVIGLPDLAAADEAAFVRLATTLAKSPERLAAWRTAGPTSLRDIMANSPLCDARAFASRFQAAIRQAWQAWCASPK